MSSVFDIGDVAQLTVRFAIAGVGTNPTTVVLTILDPENVVTTPAATSDGSGVYHYNLSLTKSGIYRYKFVGTGAVAEKVEGSVTVRPTRLVSQPPGSVTPFDLNRSALRLIQVMGAPGRTSSPEVQEEGVEVLNSMLSAWRLEGYLAYATQRSTHATVADQAEYSIGEDGTPDIDLVRPNTIEFAGLIDSGNSEFPLEIYTPQKWAGIPDKTTTGIPGILYYEPTVPNGTITLWPVPDAVYTLVLYTRRLLTRVSSLTEAMILPDGYQKAIEYNLALELAPRHKNAVVQPWVISTARSAKLYIKRMNQQPMAVSSNYPTSNTAGLDLRSGR